MLFLLSGCSSVKLGYNYADWYLYYRIDNLFDLDSSQENFIDPKIDEFHLWHRKSELPKYIVFLKGTKRRLADGLTSEDVEWIRTNYRALRNNSADRLSKDTAVFLATIREEQVQRMEEKLAERNKKVEAELKLSDKELREKYAQNIYDVLEEWFGDLTDLQRKTLEEKIEIDREALHKNLERQKIKQKKFAALLRESNDPKEIEGKIIEWYLKPELFRSPDYQRLVERRVSKGKRLLFVFDSMVLPHQREHALSHLQDYIDDLEYLVKN